MISAPLPENETDRLAALHAYDILDTPSERAFDRVTRHAADVLAAPVVLVSLIDETRQWFKSAVGLEDKETPRDLAFCAHAILQDRVMVVEDARRDPRFSDNMLVTGPPGIRTYAGAPLITPQGYRLGTLCVIYTEVTPFGALYQERLRALADVVTDALELRRHAAEAGSLARAKNAFFLNISHEVRTPLNGVLGMLDLLQDGTLTQEQAARVEDATAAAGRLLTFANDVMDLSQIEADNIVLNERDFEPEKVAAQVIRTFAESGGDRALRLHRRQGLPGAVRADADRFGQILGKLIAKALAVSKGESVDVTLSWAKGQLIAEVADRGPGLSAQTRRRLFDPFRERQNALRADDGSSALGLAVSQKLARVMGGTLRAEPRRGGGTVFRLRVPAAQAASAGAASPTSHGALRVLIAEDNTVNQAVLKAFVEKLGHEVHLADDGEAALFMAEEGGYDLVLMDVQMPRLDGIEATKAIRALGPAFRDLPIVAVTANAAACNEAEYRAAGMNGYVPKPVKLSVLEQAIREAMHEKAALAFRRTA